MKYHLAILTPGWIELILEGSKTIESDSPKSAAPRLEKSTRVIVST